MIIERNVFITKCLDRSLEILDAVESLNSSYGKGEVVNLSFDSLEHGTFTIRPFQCVEEKRKWRIKNNTLFALRHQKKLP